MATIYVRSGGATLRYLTAALMALIAFLSLQLAPLYPLWLVSAMSLAIGGAALASPASAALALVTLASLPVIVSDLVVGVVLLICALALTQYLAFGRATAFIMFALGILAVRFHAEWAFAALAGYLLGRGHGALTGASICLALEAAGLALGVPSIGSVVTGGSAPALFQAAAAPTGGPTVQWLAQAIDVAEPSRIWATISAANNMEFLVTQPLIWGAGGMIAGGSRAGDPLWRPLVLAAGGVTAILGGNLALDLLQGGPLSFGLYALTGAASAAFAVVTTGITARFFPLTPLQEPRVAGPAATAPSDVDGLLRVIASAEDQLTSQHRTNAVVLITDMKSFSALTEEIGSLESAKLVQRHRDLLLPIVAAHAGHGQATGGDGLVAAFETSEHAVAAAMEMQRTLGAYCTERLGGTELSIRIGIAQGEVVLDAGGRPFLGTALNLAARVMDLADGGRIMTTSAVAATSALPDSQRHSHGDFKLKNIAESVPVTEVLWCEGMSPQLIRGS